MKRSLSYRQRGQVALEYALTTLMLALIASLLYVIYQPLVLNTFSPMQVKNRPLGVKETLYLPIP